MANYCDYDMRVRGRKGDIKKLVDWMNARYSYIDPANPQCYLDIDGVSTEVEHHLGYRTFEVNYDFEDNLTDGEVITMNIWGYVAWSLSSCWFRHRFSYFHNADSKFAIPLDEACKKLNLQVEVFSSEPGCVFSEHYIINEFGEIICDNTVEYHEIYIGDYDNYEQFLVGKEGDSIKSKVNENMFNEAEDYITICDHLDEFGEWKFTYLV